MRSHEDSLRSVFHYHRSQHLVICSNLQKWPNPILVSKGDKSLWEVLINTPEAHIPLGKVHDYQTGATPENLSLIQERDVIRKAVPIDPWIPQLILTIQTSINTILRETWRGLPITMPSWCQQSYMMATTSNPQATHNLQQWNSLNRKQQPHASEIWNKFTKPVPFHITQQTRQILRKIRRQHQPDQDTYTFTSNLVRNAIKDISNSTASSPDNLIVITLHLHQLDFSARNTFAGSSTSHTEMMRSLRSGNKQPNNQRAPTIPYNYSVQPPRY